MLVIFIIEFALHHVCMYVCSCMILFLNNILKGFFFVIAFDIYVLLSCYERSDGR